ncbi:MAG: Trk family potassium uptake protein [Clostridia bacterium]|nr:Trk family potassium uptake protein [Clostridia bacterium]
MKKRDKLILDIKQANSKNNPIINREDAVSPTAPARVIVLSFLLVILVGTALLCMPFSSVEGKFTDPLTAMFTATTSTCVTGLILVDTGSYWSFWGQLIILLLVQIGGIGLVTFSAFFMVIFRQKLGLNGMLLTQSSVGLDSFRHLKTLLKVIVLSTLVIESVGAALLSIRFVPMFGISEGIWRSVFTSISAYCNAGLDLLEGDFTSLTAFSGDVLVNCTVMGLIILGGLGFLVFQDIIFYRKNDRLMLHTKVVLIATALFTLAGALMFFAFEYQNPKTLGGLPFGEKVLASFFQSVTLRTAGFNTIDFAGLGDHTKFLSSVFMFFGAAPGSTGGGVKITTFAVLLMTVVATYRNRQETVIMGRRIDQGVVYKSMSLVAAGILVVAALTAVIVFEDNGVELVDALVEASSAFATVGITAGATLKLGLLSKVLVIVTMFIGRVGTLSLIMALTLKENQREDKIVRPKGEIMVG